MRFGLLRRVAMALVMISSMATARVGLADGFGHTIPPEVLAYDINTGGPYFAPPVPWGHYAKDGLFDSYGHTKGCLLHSLCLGKGCKGCGGKGCNGIGHGLFGGNGGNGGKCGHGLFNHCGNGGQGGKCGHGLFNHCGNGGDGCGEAGCSGGHGLGHGKRIKDCGLCKGKGCGLCKSSGSGDPIYALSSEQGPARVTPAPQVIAQSAPLASSQCSDPGCGMGKGHHGDHGSLCDGCGGKGNGCGKCGGLGFFKKHHAGDPCDSCGGKGCGKCGLFGGKGGCGFCGGKGCGKCGLGGLGSGLHGKLSGLLHPHRGNIKYFVGPGGPVPLTPGYVPYIVTTRSPRDFLSFPPYTPSNP